MSINPSSPSTASFKPGKPKKTLTISVVVILALLIGTCVYGYVSLDWFKSAKQVYLETEAKNSQALLNSFDDSFNKLQTDFKPFLEDSVHSTQDITASITTASSQLDPQTQLILGILQRSKITLETSQDPKAKQYTAKLGYSANGATPITLQAFQDADKAGFAIPTFNPKFLVENYKDTDAIKKNLGIQNLPQKVVTTSDVLNALKTSKAELTPIIDPYAKLYAGALQNDQVKATAGDITLGDTQMKGKTYTVTFTETQAADLTNKLADQLASDDQLVNFLYTKYTNVINLYQASGVKLDKVQSKEDIKNCIAAYAKDLKDQAKDQKPMSMIVSVDANKKIVERKLTETGTDNSFRLASWTNAGQDYFQISLKTTEDKNTSSLDLAYTKKAQDSQTNKGTLNLAVKETGATPSDFTLKSDFTETKASNKTSFLANVNLNANDSKGQNQLSGSFNQDQTIENNGKNRTSATAIKLNLDSPSEGLKGAVLNLNVTGKYDFGNPVDLPKLDAANTLDLGKATQADMDQYDQELQQGLGRYLQSEPALLQMVLPFILAGGL